jgi:hypothetical protein
MPEPSRGHSMSTGRDKGRHDACPVEPPFVKPPHHGEAKYFTAFSADALTRARRLGGSAAPYRLEEDGEYQASTPALTSS